MRALLYIVGVFVASLVGAVVGAFLLFALGLFVPAYVVIPLTLAFAALIAALAASWAANLFAPDGSDTVILHVIVASEGTAVLIGLSLFLLTVLVPMTWPFPAVPLLLAVLVIAVGGTLATARFRVASRSLGRDALYSVGYLVGGLGVVVVVVVITCSLVPCIP